MAKKRNSEALFEVISRTRDSQDPSMIHVPAWMSKKPPEQDAADGDEPKQQAQAEQAQPMQPLDAAPAKPRSFEILRPLLAIGDKRVAISLNYLWCGVLGLAMVTLVLSAFLLGWKMGGPSDVRPREPVPEKREVLGEEDLTTTTPPAPLPERVDGKYYMLIQGVGSVGEQHLAEAKKIVDYCAKANLPADIGQMRDPTQYVVWSLTGFDSPDSPEAKKYFEQIKALGKKYKADHGTYEFKQPDPVGKWPWFHQYRPRG